MDKAHTGVWCALILLASSMPARAEVRAWTPDELVAQALVSNAELKSYEHAVAVAKGERAQAGAFKNPEVAVEIGSREVRDSENVLQGNGTTFSASITQTLEFPGKGTLRKAIANRNIQIAELGLEQFRHALVGKVRLLALEYLAASADSTVAEQVGRESTELAGTLKGKSQGARQTLELRLINGNLLSLQEAVRTAEVRRETARAELIALLGWPQAQPISIRAELKPPMQKFDTSKLVFASQQNNPLLRIRHAEVERAGKQLAATRLEIAPDLAIGPFFSRDVAGETETNIGGAITATVPVWDWNVGNIASAKARREQAQTMRVQAEREAEAAVVRTLRIYEITTRQLGRMPQDARSGLREASSLANQQYRSGAIGVQLYLDTQREYVNATQTWNVAVLEAWKALLDLDLLTGGRAVGKEAP
jgi:cobalt-zinc-cadmium efflux system outer membrane protein